MALLGVSSTEGSLGRARARLEKLQRRLDIGVSLPTLSAKAEPLAQTGHPPLPLAPPQDPPGGRHDNDHADICAIRIMPTFQEISCSLPEYLPVKDPRHWHVGGLAGLLDRNFRLLREDTVGQLRDVIHTQLKFAPRGNSLKQGQLRSYVYQKARVQQLKFDRFAGLQLLVQFPQPSNVRPKNKEQRQEWWNASKRLQPSALVCLTDPRGVTVFCTVTSPVDASPHGRERTAGSSLWADGNTASITLELAEPTEDNWRYVLDCYQSGNAGSSSLLLVEFPGVLLPAFHATLRALQDMKRAADLPMSEFLAPLDPAANSGLVHVSPPEYAVAPGFSFDLGCLMDDGSNLELRPGQQVDLDKLKAHSTLDDAQANALVQVLQRRIGLIQGPPGTGKSYTGVALIKVLLANKSKIKGGLGPIVCVCYTNHALDQLLEDLWKSRVTAQIVRIGSQSKSELLEPLNLRTAAQRISRTKLEKQRQYQLHGSLDFYDKSFTSLGLAAMGSDRSLVKYLERHHPHHYRQFFGKDDNGFTQVARGKPSKTISSWLHSGPKRKDRPRALEQLIEVPINEMTAKERRLLYEFWVKQSREQFYEQAISLLSSHGKTKTSLDGIRDELNLRCLNSADVVGVTTTGLARNLKMLRRLKSKVILCEEAGEVLEAHMLTSMLPSTEHLILIGDHQQLRPQIQNYELSRENRAGQQYSLDRSLFERLVEPDDGVGPQIPFCTLETQRRMHPSIARLIRDTLYPRLQDAPSVHQYPEVMGMRKRLFWLDHQHPEGNAASDDALATSHWNDHEINVTLCLVNHLLRQGTYQSGEIAVLTPYLGQLHRLRRKLGQSFAITLGERDQEDLDRAGFTGGEEEEEEKGTRPTVNKSTLLRALRVATIDNFQGEEAKVVVISLVRSNSQGRCGFLRTPNRINVLLSRAQHGMYIIGNSETAKGVEMWAQVLAILAEEGNIGPALDLKCPRHPDAHIAVSEPDDFVQFSPEGGCSLRCGKRLPCGHPCKQKCHSEMLHQAVFCLEPCPRPREGCTHPCAKRCGDPCPRKCLVTVVDEQRVLACGHSAASLVCWQAQDLSAVKCPVLVQKRVPRCNHEVTVACHVDVSKADYQCQHRCLAILPCGHTCKRLCRECTVRTADGVQVDHGRCQTRCGRPYSTCAHTCAANCHGKEPCPPCMEECTVQCGHSRCSRKCSEPCAPCAVAKCLSACPHSECSLPCAAPCDHIPCSRRCSKILECGHRCPSLCGELCPSRQFCQVCATDDIKKTPVDFILGETYEQIDLNVNPCIFPPCGHFLTMESMDAQMDLRRHYVLDDEGRPTGIASSSEPFSIDDIRTCATCRGSLRSIARYGRLVRRALLDETTKKFILYMNRQYAPLAEELPRLLTALWQRNEESAAARAFQQEVEIQIVGPRGHQVNLMSAHFNKYDKARWQGLLALRGKIVEYHNRVKQDEQPFIQVRDRVEDARRRKQTRSEQFDFDESVLQTKGQLQASALLLRLDTALLGDFLGLYRQTKRGPNTSQLRVNLQANRRDCEQLIELASRSHRVLEQAEGNLFLAQLYALEKGYVTAPTQVEQLLTKGTEALDAAKALCARHPNATRGLAAEIDGTETMLSEGTFYTPVSNEERMAVVAAMAREFRGTGHWYYCQNGHPFTIGECGGAMQLSRCPECGAPVGGQDHRTVAGVTRASDLEEGLRRLEI
ncbi:hypothetical protein VTO42DRAFT_785 [Malbranchea cinnamomea]